MTINRISRKAKVLGLPLGVAGIAAAALLAGGTMSTTAVARSSPDQTLAEASKLLAKGKTEKAIELAETAVAANPREPSYRALLGQAYFKAGRFDSAITTFNDAMKLGDNSARTALALALADVAAGRNRDAIAILDDWRDAIPGSDLGLAMALAGEPGRGVAILADELRAGDATAKLRQNLAYAYALDGRWREARLMAAQDIPADQLDKRLSAWAANAQPEAAKARVAALIRAPLRDDPGQPRMLALGDSPAGEQLAAETAATQTLATTSELPAVAAAPAAAPASTATLAQYTPVSTPDETAMVAPAETPAAQAPTFASAFAAQPVAAQAAPRTARPARVATVKTLHKQGLRPRGGVVARGGSHAVQLGSFSSQQGARRAWGIFAAKNPELRKYRMQITQATVHGKQYWRVAAAGFDKGSASGLCSTVKTRGGACFAYATNRFAPGGKAVAAPALAQARKPVQQIRVAAAASVRGAAGRANLR
ncbi:sporulation related protein [Novosphingobium kunmingense]|uniref:Sporulation related protein n=1 Tax=Novosphingobium kunmingense TaxID=1211806 RepID=A0A2N0HKF9_9SPHN|nr:SPOR domain-containing protein [Novosphingobium kunmingense]PKB19440.1 sporulation related protein [Novosphingobium kunmingense]